jgi:hypothetical protein
MRSEFLVKSKCSLAIDLSGSAKCLISTRLPCLRSSRARYFAVVDFPALSKPIKAMIAVMRPPPYRIFLVYGSGNKLLPCRQI